MESIKNQDNAVNVWHIADHKTIGINWVNEKRGEWTAREYAISHQQILWRGEMLELEGGVKRTESGATVTVKIIYQGKTYCPQFTLHKWMAGSHGDPKPDIKTESHRLHIMLYISGLTLSDIPLDKSATGTTDSFFIQNKNLADIQCR